MAGGRGPTMAYVHIQFRENLPTGTKVAMWGQTDRIKVTKSTYFLFSTVPLVPHGKHFLQNIPNINWSVLLLL
jgi:hypothetical protein